MAAARRDAKGIDESFGAIVDRYVSLVASVDSYYPFGEKTGRLKFKPTSLYESEEPGTTTEELSFFLASESLLSFEKSPPLTLDPFLIGFFTTVLYPSLLFLNSQKFLELSSFPVYLSLIGLRLLVMAY